MATEGSTGVRTASRVSHVSRSGRSTVFFGESHSPRDLHDSLTIGDKSLPKRSSCWKITKHTRETPPSTSRQGCNAHSCIHLGLPCGNTHCGKEAASTWAYHVETPTVGQKLHPPGLTMREHQLWDRSCIHLGLTCETPTVGQKLHPPGLNM